MSKVLLNNLHTRLVAFRDEVAAKDMIVPAWVVDSIEEVEAAQHKMQRTAEKRRKNCPCGGKVLHADWCPKNRRR